MEGGIEAGRKAHEVIRKAFALLKRTLTKYDLILIVFLIVLTLASFSLWFGGKPGRRAVILVDGKMIREFPLDGKEEVLEIQGVRGLSCVEIRQGRLRMKDSACPNKTCVKMGWIAQDGQMICCIPNRVVIKILGEREDGIDALAR